MIVVLNSYSKNVRDEQGVKFNRWLLGLQEQIFGMNLKIWLHRQESAEQRVVHPETPPPNLILTLKSVCSFSLNSS